MVRALYDTPWLDVSLQFQRSLMIIVARAQSTLHLTGGKIYIMSLETFQAVSVFKLRMEEVTSGDGWLDVKRVRLGHRDQWRGAAETIVEFWVP